MLTADLVRARVRKGVVRPMYLRGNNANAEHYAAALCDLYARADGWSRRRLEEARRDLVGDATDFLLARGFAKLLDDRCTWETQAACEPAALRAMLYDANFRAEDAREGVIKARRRARGDVIREVAEALGLREEQVEASMFGDHRDAEIRTAYDGIDPDALLRRYDVSLAQAVLLRAQSVRIAVRAARAQQLRALIHAVKFRRLLFRITRDEAGAWVLEIDGPMSILQRATRYGLQLAMLVPTLLHLEAWTLQATVRWPKRREPVEFALSDGDGLAPVGRLKGAWVSEEQTLLETRLSAHKTAWRIEPAPALLPLGPRDLFAPEMTLVHPDGRRAYVEIVGTWRRRWLRDRVALLRAEGPPNTVLCVSRKLAADKEGLDGFDGDIVEFAHVISVAQLLKAVEAVAVVGG